MIKFLDRFQKGIFFIILAMVLLSPSSVRAETKLIFKDVPINLSTGNTYVDENGFTMVPAIEMAEKLGLKTIHSEDRKTLFVFDYENGKNILYLADYGVAGGAENREAEFEEINIGTNAVYKRKVFFVPLRQLTNYFGFELVVNEGIIEIKKSSEMW